MKSHGKWSILGKVLSATAVFGVMGVACLTAPANALTTFPANPGVWGAGTATFTGQTGVTALLNTGTDTDGFDSAFTASFVRVGSRPGQFIGAANNTATTSVAQTDTTFGNSANMQSLGTTPSLQFVSLSFNYLFDGQEDTPGSHTWQVELIRYNDVANDPTDVSIVAALAPFLTSVETPF